MVLLNHSKTNLNMHPHSLIPFCTFHIPILNIIPCSVYFPRQCPVFLQSQLCDATRDIIVLRVVEHIQTNCNSETLNPPNRRDCLQVIPRKKTTEPILIISTDAHTLFSHGIFCRTHLKLIFENRTLPHTEVCPKKSEFKIQGPQRYDWHLFKNKEGKRLAAKRRERYQWAC